MTRLKTHAGASKRFKISGSGKYLHKASRRRHLLRKRSTKAKRHLRGSSVVGHTEHHIVKSLLLQ